METTRRSLAPTSKCHHRIGKMREQEPAEGKVDILARQVICADIVFDKFNPRANPRTGLAAEVSGALKADDLPGLGYFGDELRGKVWTRTEIDRKMDRRPHLDNGFFERLSTHRSIECRESSQAFGRRTLIAEGVMRSGGIAHRATGLLQRARGSQTNRSTTTPSSLNITALENPQPTHECFLPLDARDKAGLA